MQDIRVQVESMPVDKSMGINNREDTYRLNEQAFLTCLLSSPISIKISTTLAQPLAISLTKIKASATIAKAVPTRGAGAFVDLQFRSSCACLLVYVPSTGIRSLSSPPKM